MEDATTSNVCRIGVRIPPFWPEEPALWFSQIEGQFALSNITSDATKFYYVAAQLDNQFAVEVKDIIISPPETDKYVTLKTQLIKRLSASQEKKVMQLLRHEQLGDRKPSQFLRYIQDLAGLSVPKDFLKTLWSSRLPQNIQTVIASQPDLPIEKLADLADKVHEIAPSSPQVASTSAMATPPAPSMLEEMAKQIQLLTKQVSELSTQVRHNSIPFKFRERSRSHSRHRRKLTSHQKCWYHFKFGSNAKKCVQPCTYGESENSLGSRK